MRKLLIFLTIGLFSTVYAEPLINLVQIADGLEIDSNENIADDFIRLSLINPTYQTAAAIQQSIEDWLGPNMVIIDSVTMLKVQAPRDSTKRIQFISALLTLDIQE